MKKKSVGQFVRELREEAGLSQVDLGELTGMAQSYICKIELGQISLTPASIEKLAEHLGNRFNLYYLTHNIPMGEESEFVKFFNREKLK